MLLQQHQRRCNASAPATTATVTEVTNVIILHDSSHPFELQVTGRGSHLAGLAEDWLPGA